MFVRSNTLLHPILFFRFGCMFMTRRKRRIISEVCSYFVVVHFTISILYIHYTLVQFHTFTTYILIYPSIIPLICIIIMKSERSIINISIKKNKTLQILATLPKTFSFSRKHIFSSFQLSSLLLFLLANPITFFPKND